MRTRPQNPDKSRQNISLFWITYLVTIALVVFRGPDLSVPFWNIGNDDAMRLVEVRDLLGGQGWFDLMQYRLGADGGTAMHWSRLVDLPIAIMIRAFSLVMPMDWAEAVTMTLWPILLIGPTLWAMYVASIRFGGTSAGLFGLIFTAIAIVVSEKYDPGSLDHHNVQMLLVALALMALMSPDNTLKNGAIAGVACALSLTVGFETMLFVVAISLSVAVIWLWIGQNLQNRTMGFSGGFTVTLIVIFLITWPGLTTTAFQCDAFDQDLLLVGSIGAGGLMVLSWRASHLSIWARLLGIIILGAIVLASAKIFAPACLSNPLSQLNPDVATEWLARITETKSLKTSVKSDGAGNFGLLIIPVIAMLYAAIFMRTKALRPQAIILLATIAAAYAMTFYQLRGLFFLLLLCVVPIAAMLGKLYARYQQVRTPVSGILVIAVLLISVPDSWSMAYIQFGKGPVVSTTTQSSEHTVPFDACLMPSHLLALSELPVGMIASSTDMGAVLVMNTHHSVLSANFHRNQDGIQTGIDLAKADLSEAYRILVDTGIDYVVYCRGDLLPLRISVENPDGLWPTLYVGEIPEFLSPAYASFDGVIHVYNVLK